MKKKTVFAAGMTVLMFAAIVIIFLFVFAGGSRYTEMRDNEKSYTEIAKICLEHRDEHGEDIICDIPGAGQVHESTIYCNKCNAPFNVDVTDAAKAVRSSYHFGSQGLAAIRVYENFVSFGEIHGSKAYIYSENGQKPTFVNDPDEENEKKPYVEKITDNWYYAGR